MLDGFVNGCLIFSEEIVENQILNAISDALDFVLCICKIMEIKNEPKIAEAAQLLEKIINALE